jgi:hypothetical protein
MAKKKVHIPEIAYMFYMCSGNGQVGISDSRQHIFGILVDMVAMSVIIILNGGDVKGTIHTQIDKALKNQFTPSPHLCYNLKAMLSYAAASNPLRGAGGFALPVCRNAWRQGR